MTSDAHTAVDPVATAATRARYERLAKIYDRVEGAMERRYRPWREQLWAEVQGPRILEVGVGTGKNLPYWPRDQQLTGIDLTPGMLAKAQHNAHTLGLAADLRLGDVQALDFPDACFDSAVATFVFCSVPDPVLGLRELARVVRPGGQILLLEHMRSPNPTLGALMDVLNHLVVPMMGANINRRTVDNIRTSGLQIKNVADLALGGIFKLISASPLSTP